MKNYSAILFDLDGTLRFHCPSGFEAFILFLAEQDVRITPEQAHAGERWAHAYWADRARVRNHMARYDQAFWLHYTREQIQALGVDDPDGRLAHHVHTAFESRYQPETCLEPAAHHVLSTLRARGYTLGLVSNRLDPLPPLMAELGLDGYFSFALASGEIDCWKPDPGIFLQACQQGQCEPHASVYVGDNYYADVIGAQAAGLTAVLYDPRDLFPQVACPRIKGLNELLTWLESKPS